MGALGSGVLSASVFTLLVIRVGPFVLVVTGVWCIGASATPTVMCQ